MKKIKMITLLALSSFMIICGLSVSANIEPAALAPYTTSASGSDSYANNKLTLTVTCTVEPGSTAILDFYRYSTSTASGYEFRQLQYPIVDNQEQYQRVMYKGIGSLYKNNAIVKGLYPTAYVSY